MQVKKEELRKDIYQAACQEFLHKGYEASSMRSIARKANTSIGNIYHYYVNKEALLDEMMEHCVKDAYVYMEEHLLLELLEPSAEAFNEILEGQTKEDMFQEIRIFLQPEFVIFLKQEQPKYREKKQQFISIWQRHLAWHFKIKDPNDYFIKLFVNMFIESLVFAVKSNQKKEKIIEDLIRLFRMVSVGLSSKE